MKNSFILPLLVVVCVMPFESITAAHAKARLMFNDQTQENVVILSYKAGVLTYKLSEKDLNRKLVRAPKLESFYFIQPKIFIEAMALYNGRNYAEAKEKFTECEMAYKSIDTAPNNYSSLAGFYKMECSRRMFDLSSLSQEMEKFLKTGLTRESHIQQLEVNAFWEAVRLKEWDRLDRLAQAWRKRKVTGSQRAQIAYCHGVALENLSKKDPHQLSKALIAYNIVMSADFTASVELVIRATSNTLALYDSDEGVKQAIRFWKTEDENPNSTGYLRLMEANAVVKLYKQAGFDQNFPLKANFVKFQKYAPSAE